MGSAAVSIREIDLSTTVPQYPGVYGGMVVRANRGPLGEAVIVSSETDFLRKFTANERVDVGMYLEYFSALAFLQKSDKLWAVRAYHVPSDTTDRTTWVAATAYTLGDVVIPTDPVAGLAYECTDAGTSGAAEPTWPSTIDGTVKDGTGETEITWKCILAQKAPLYGGMKVVKSDATGYHTTLTDGKGLATPSTYNSFVTDDSFLIYASDPGEWNNNVYIQVVTGSTVKETGAFILNVYKKLTNTSYQLLETWTCSLTEGHLDGYGRNIYIEDVLTGSAYIRALVKKPVTLTTVKANPVASASWAATTAYTQGQVISPTSSTNTSIAFVCTTAGTSASSEASWTYTIGGTTTQGTAVFTAQYAITPMQAGDDGDAPTTGDMMRAADLLRNTDSVPLTMLMDGGYTTPAYQLYLDEIANARRDSVAILSLPYSQEAAAKVNGVQGIVTYKQNNLTAIATSSYSAMYMGWVKIYDKFNDRELWVDPTGFMGAVISYTGANYELWYPAAGWRRGPIRVLDVLQHLSKTERDLVYDANINPIKWDLRRGIAVFGQKTTLARPSSLDRLNVRLLLCVIEPLIAYALEDFLFEINDQATRALVYMVINSYMQGIKSRRGVYDFKVKCDEENNTPEDIDAHKLNVHLFIKPVQSIEYIQFNVVITRTGMDFNLAAQSLMAK